MASAGRVLTRALSRTITREADEAVMEAMAARVAAHPEKMRLRKQLCEHPFGTLKRWFGYSYFLLNGLEKVRGEWELKCRKAPEPRAAELFSLARTRGAPWPLGSSPENLPTRWLPPQKTERQAPFRRSHASA